jgi:hypothetical protein
MKTQYFLRSCFCLFFIALSFSCGKGGSDVVDTLIPDLSAGWKNTNETTKDDEYFFVDVPDAGKASSAFNGNENSDFTGSGEIHSFSGSYTNSKISFTFNDGPKQGQKYSGTIKGTAPTATMTLTTPSGTITLQQHQ